MRHMEGEAGRAQTRVTEQQLDAAQVDPICIKLTKEWSLTL